MQLPFVIVCYGGFQGPLCFGIDIKSEECAQEISSYFICFTQQMKVIINCGKSGILKSKQVVSLAKRISNKFFQCLQSSPPASTRSLQLPFVNLRTQK